ncbi:MAG TPA: tetratricopeptide repeat protein, partial [Anaerolineae bacterium]|nr:tetratricopeptide repeat protein [Anaerolineae bacterium]
TLHQQALFAQVQGDIHLNMGDTTAAQTLYAAALRVEADRHGAWQPERVYLGLARCDFIQGDIAKAEQKAHTALDIAVVENDPHNMLEASMLYGMAVADLGNVAEAHTRFTAALTLAQQLNNRMSEARALGALGHIERDQRQAIAYYEASLEIWRKIGDKHSLAIETGNLGSVYQEVGQLEQAMACYRESRQMSEAMGDQLGTIFCDAKSAELLCEQTKFDQSRPHWQQALTTARAIASDYWLLYPLVGFAWLTIAHDPSQAATYLALIEQHQAANIETKRLIEKVRSYLPDQTVPKQIKLDFAQLIDSAEQCFRLRYIEHGGKNE